MNIIYEKSTDKNLTDAIQSLESNLRSNGFGVLWQLNFKDKLQEKGLELKDDFVVLEVCNPKQAKDVLDYNIYIGYVLPCKMVVRRENNKTYIGMLRPEVMIGLFESPELKSISQKVEDSLKNTIEDSI